VLAAVTVLSAQTPAPTAPSVKPAQPATPRQSDVADAAMRGDAAAVRGLIAKKADVNAPQNDGATALHWAVFKGDRELAIALMRAGANPKAANREGVTPLWLASVNGDGAMIRALIEAGGDANETLALGRTPLMLAARTGNVEAIRALLDNGADPNAKETLRGTTAMMWAADEGHAAAIQLLIERGADKNAKSNPAQRGGGPALGKSNDPRRAVAQNVAAFEAQRAGRAGPAQTLRVADGDDTPNAAGGRAGGAAGRAGGGAPDGAAAAGGGGRGGGRAGGAGGGRGGAAGRGNADGADAADADDDAAVAAGFGRNTRPADGGGLTPLIYAARANDLESVKVLLDAGVDVNQQTAYGWSALLVATQNRYYKLAAYLIERGADVNLANNGGWVPLYLATDNRNIENGDYPVRKPDMDHLDFIKLLLDKGANVNHQIKDSSETRTVFTNQWLDENGATAFLRASQSGDVELMKLLLARGADPKINARFNVSPLHVAAGIGWVEGITFEWSPQQTLEAVKMLLDLGLDPNLQADTGRVALHGAAHKGHVGVIQALYDAGAKLDVRDYGNTDHRGSELAGITWLPVDYADGLVRVGVQSAIAHPEAGLLLRKLMEKEGMKAPPMGRTLDSICITDACEPPPF
jgi:ankyrin repeat protein